MDLLFIAYLCCLLMGLLISFVFWKNPYPLSIKNFFTEVILDLDFTLKNLGWYPVRDFRQYVVLMFGIIIGYSLAK